MLSLDKAVTAKITRKHAHFEILVDPTLALDFKKGKEIPVEDILAVPEIFKDSRKGERVSEKELEENFKTTEVKEIASQILKHGEIQFTTEQRRKLVEDKKKEIAYMISKRGVDPKTNLPHPANRVMNAIDEAHVNLDPFKPSSDQLETVLEGIRPILPIKIETVEIAVKIPMQYAGKASSALRTITPVKKEEWKQDGWIAVIDIPAGMQSEILSKLNDMTSGSVETKILSHH
jgi:ribosome maturation protein SDO1